MTPSSVPFKAVYPTTQTDLDTTAGARLSPAAAVPAPDARWNKSHAPVLSSPAAAGDSRAPAQTGSRLITLAGAVCVLLATLTALVLFCFDPRQYHFYPICLFHQTTGLLCPGCGALRAMHQLLHGHLAVAFQFNPMLIVSLPF